MHHPPRRQYLSFLLLFTVSAASDAFLSLGKGQRRAAVPPPASSKTKFSIRRRPTTVPHQSSHDEDGSSVINVALIASTITNESHSELESMLKNHPFCKMSGVQLSVADVPASAAAASWSEEHVALLHQADIACFESMSAVQSYLENLDDHLNIPKDASDEDRKKYPIKPDLLGGATEGGEAVLTGDMMLMAACPNADTARECLNSGRWIANHIYYPKETRKAVQLKTELISGESNTKEEDKNIDVELWAESVVQAAGDVMERKFWGGGW